MHILYICNLFVLIVKDELLLATTLFIPFEKLYLYIPYLKNCWYVVVLIDGGVILYCGGVVT